MRVGNTSPLRPVLNEIRGFELMITAGMVKELRERTGVGMMDCKNALLKPEVTWKRL